MTQESRIVLVTGATGLLGRQVMRVFNKSSWITKGIGFSRADGHTILKIDLSEPTDIEKALDSIKPQIVIHCAADRHPASSSTDPSRLLALNVTATRSLARLCASRSISLLYVSTDYVFPGKPGEAPYEANHPPGPPTNLYGQSKLDGERAVVEAYSSSSKKKEKEGAEEEERGTFEGGSGGGEEGGGGGGKEEYKGTGVVLRVPVLYGEAEKPAESAVNVLMDTVRQAAGAGAGAAGRGGEGVEEKIRADHWALRYPTNTEDVARVCYDIAIKFLEEGHQKAQSLPRILQFSAQEKFTKYEMCEVFGRLMHLSIDRIEPDTTGDSAASSSFSSVQRPYDCHLSTRALENLGIDVSAQNFEGWWKRAIECQSEH